MNFQTSELKGIKLDWAVGKGEGEHVYIENDTLYAVGFPDDKPYSPTTDSKLIVKLIEKYMLKVENPRGSNWEVCMYTEIVVPRTGKFRFGMGDTLGEAIARCVVRFHFGDEIEILADMVVKGSAALKDRPDWDHLGSVAAAGARHDYLKSYLVESPEEAKVIDLFNTGLITPIEAVNQLKHLWVQAGK